MSQHPEASSSSDAQSSRRSFGKALMMWVRRAHLYLGLLLFPWAILYGVTAFLFNHPTVFSDSSAPTVHFEPSATVGTPLDTLESPQLIAEQVLAKLNESQKPATPYLLATPANFASRDGRSFAFATVKAENQSLNVLVDLKSGGGTVRGTATREKKEPEKAPFAVGTSTGGGRVGRGPGGPGGGRGGPRGDMSSRGGEGVNFDKPLHESIKAAIPTILERTGFATGEVTITSVPDVVFGISANGKTWTANYNPMTGSVSGTPSNAKPENELGWRRFLLRLHTAHGYPSETGSRWFWAVIVDLMAFTMCFWGFSGLLMWWQLKATRKLGAIILVLSAISATALGLAMHIAMSS
jgi:hypothetical protein